jgi:hypothetical protein
MEQDRCDGLLRAYKDNPDYNPNAHCFALPWLNYLSGDDILGPVTKKLSPTVSKTSSDTTIKFSNEDQSVKPPPLLARDNSSDDDSLFGHSKSSVQSVRSIQTLPQLQEGYANMLDPIYHEDEKYYLLHPSITQLAHY